MSLPELLTQTMCGVDFVLCISFSLVVQRTICRFFYFFYFFCQLHKFIAVIVSSTHRLIINIILSGIHPLSEGRKRTEKVLVSDIFSFLFYKFRCLIKRHLNDLIKRSLQIHIKLFFFKFKYYFFLAFLFCFSCL